jgi:hypothetical protein
MASSLMTIAQNSFHRLTTRRGTLRGGKLEGNYGYDLRELIGLQSTTSLIASIPWIVRAELTKDPRILTTTTTVSVATDGPFSAYTIEVLATTSEGTFDMVMSVDKVTAKLLKLEAV